MKVQIVRSIQYIYNPTDNRPTSNPLISLHLPENIQFGSSVPFQSSHYFISPSLPLRLSYTFIFLSTSTPTTRPPNLPPHLYHIVGYLSILHCTSCTLHFRHSFWKIPIVVKTKPLTPQTTKYSPSLFGEISTPIKFPFTES